MSIAYHSPRLLRSGDDLKSFACRSSEQTEWLRNHARQASAAGTARTLVVTKPDSPAVVGYYAWRMDSILRKKDHMAFFRRRLAAKLAKSGTSPEDIRPIVMALHPFDVAPVPQRDYEAPVRTLMRATAKQQRQMGGLPLPERADAARAVLAEYRALAFAHGEVYYQTRFDELIDSEGPRE